MTDKRSVDEMEGIKKTMLAHLEQMQESGVKLFMDGHAVLPGEAVAKTVRENSPYMADYVLNDSGVIEQVRFDRVMRK